MKGNPHTQLCNGNYTVGSDLSDIYLSGLHDLSNGRLGNEKSRILLYRYFLYDKFWGNRWRRRNQSPLYLQWMSLPTDTAIKYTHAHTRAHTHTHSMHLYTSKLHWNWLFLQGIFLCIAGTKESILCTHISTWCAAITNSLRRWTDKLVNIFINWHCKIK